MILLEQDLPVCRCGRGPAGRILLVCDDPILLDSVAKAVLWSRPAYSMECVTTAAAADEALASRRFDAILACCEPHGEEARESLQRARISHGGVTRIAYLIDQGQGDSEFRWVHHVVPSGRDLKALLAVMDAALQPAAQPARHSLHPWALLA